MRGQSRLGNPQPLITVGYPIHYLFITYIVTSKPKRISVAAGLVHIMFLLVYKVHEMYTMSITLRQKIN
jgi:hypothetical protein